MQTKYFSPSVNIVRDVGADLGYIPTNNGQDAYNKIVNGFSQGTRSFTLIGSYGTGKSAFILALQKVMQGKADYFSNENGAFSSIKNYHFTNIVGEYASLRETILDKIQDTSSTSNNFWKKLDSYYSKLDKTNTAWVILIDEFGKFLEYAAGNSPDDEMYFIQQLAEYVNDNGKNIILITSLHQSFSSYAYGLSKTQRNEWDKVKGRLIEINFNEPVEQLLYLASERLSKENFNYNISSKIQKELYSAIDSSGAFPLKDFFSYDNAQNLFPFDILAASILTLSLQEYGQNERSLFTFIESHDYLGLRDFDKSNPYYNISCVYDYLIYNYYNYLSSKYNSHFPQWSSIKIAIERAETEFSEYLENYLKVIKTIGLLNIFLKAGVKINYNFLATYSKHSLGVSNPEKIIDNLSKRNIIRYRVYNERYILFEGTDVEIDSELIAAEKEIKYDTVVINYLQKYFTFPITLAKSAYYKFGTPRYFTFELTEQPSQIDDIEGISDGIINIILNFNIQEVEIKNISAQSNDAILYGYYHETKKLQKLIWEIEKICFVKEKHPDDNIVQRELADMFNHHVDRLNSVFINEFYNSKYISWYYKGEIVEIDSQKSMNKYLSFICEDIYNQTPVFRNEMVNKIKVSAAISTARKKLIIQILNNEDKEDLDFNTNTYPPQKTIYLSLLKNTGIHKNKKGKCVLGEPTDESFKYLWNECDQFLKDCNDNKRTLIELIDRLKKKPFRLKDGFIEFWIQIFLIAKRKEFAIYEEKDFIPYLNEETLDVAMRQPHKYKIQSFYLSKEKLKVFNNYRYFLNQIEEEKPTNESFIETVKPFLTFYRGLVQYSKNTDNISKEAKKLREAIIDSTDPVKMFFEDIPRALGFNIHDFETKSNKLEEFTISLKSAVRELSSAFDNLINRVEYFLNKDILGQELNFPDNKLVLQKRYKKLKSHSLNTKQKIFYQRITTALDDRKSWINSLGMAIMGKSLETINDDEEMILLDRFKATIHELDNLTEISSQKDIDQNKEEYLKLEITSFVKGVQKNLIRLPKNKTKEFVNLENQIKELLKGDKKTNIYLLIKLLQDQIENDE